MSNLQPYNPRDLNGRAGMPGYSRQNGNYPVDMPVEQEDMTSSGLMDYWRILLRRKWMILSFTVVGLLGGFLVTVPSPFIFESRTVIEVQDFNSNFMGMAQVDPQAGNYSPTELNIATEMHILQSGSLKWRVLDRLNRELPPAAAPELPGVVAKVRRKAQELAGKTSPDVLVGMRQALSRASSSLELQIVPGTRLIEIRCRSTVPDVSAAFANAIANEYIDQSLERRVKGLQRSSQWFTTQLADIKSKLELSQQRLLSLRRSGGVPANDQPAPQSLASVRASTLQQQAGAAQAERIAKEAQLQTIQNSKDSDGMLDNTVLSGMRTKVDEAKRNLAALSATLTPAHYKVKNAEAAVVEAEAALKREREALMTKLRVELDSVKERERLLTSAYSTQVRTMSSGSSSATALEASMLQQEVENNKQQYQTLLQQASQAAVASAVPANHIRIVEPAAPSTEPANLFETTALALGGMTGLLLSIAVAVIMHFLSRSVQGPGHATTVLGVRELGVVLSGKSPLIQANRNGTPVRSLLAADGQHIADEHPLIADSFRSILASILLPYRARIPQVIVVSSPDMKEGKSTVASNLGRVLSGLNRRVLLIDADLRRPQLHKIFGFENTVGLTTILSGAADLSSLKPEEAGLSAGRENLRVLPAGPATENLGSLLYSPRLEGLLALLRRHFDHILIDTPPLVRFPDARLLGTLSDGVVLVLRSGVTDMVSAVTARDLLAQDGTRLIGTILNDWTPRKREADQYRQYQNYYAQSAD